MSGQSGVARAGLGETYLLQAGRRSIRSPVPGRVMEICKGGQLS